MKNFNSIAVDSDTFGKRSLNAFRVAFETSATDCTERADAMDAMLASGEPVDSKLINPNVVSKLRTAAKYQRAALVELSDSQVKAIMRQFNVGNIVAACVDSYSLDKIKSLSIMLDTGDWNQQVDCQLAVWLVQAIDSEPEIDYVAWKKSFNGGEKRAHGLNNATVNVSKTPTHCANSPRQSAMSDVLLERLGMVTRTKTGHSYTVMTKNIEHKCWSVLEKLFDENLARLASE